MSAENNHKIVAYKTYLIILGALLALTAISVMVTWIDLGHASVATALILASVKSALVLIWFMHLRFDHMIYTIMVSLVLLIFILILVITFFDYSFR